MLFSPLQNRLTSIRNEGNPGKASVAPGAALKTRSALGEIGNTAGHRDSQRAEKAKEKAVSLICDLSGFSLLKPRCVAWGFSL